MTRDSPPELDRAVRHVETAIGRLFPAGYCSEIRPRLPAWLEARREAGRAREELVAHRLQFVRARVDVATTFAVPDWWDRLLYNQTAKRLKATLVGREHTVIADVPYRRGH